MNYLRGAVNAISAPYQYYKDINPSTLTGAIDVIVVQSPSEDGGTVLACSPFHVRFGKLQVLRPSEKKVNVSVNGAPIPFNMKIGEAGEAFFVFETEGDVPPDLVTSPILRPADEGQEPDEEPPRIVTLGPQPLSSEASVLHIEPLESTSSVGEPTHLDLDDASHIGITTAPLPTDSAHHRIDDALPSSALQEEQDRRVDEALRRSYPVHVRENAIHYGEGVTLDTEGYHSRTHEKEESEETITDELHQAELLSASQPIEPTYDQPAIPFPSLRASSEPPPQDTHPISERSETPTPADNLHLNVSPPLQEYSWDWGAFPQPSPVATTFPSSPLRNSGPWGRASSRKPLGRRSNAQGVSLHLDAPNGSMDSYRTHSVPPQGVMAPKAITEQLLSDLDVEALAVGYGAGGSLSYTPTDPTIFILKIEGQRTTFELSLIEGDMSSVRQVFSGRDEVEAFAKFDKGKVHFTEFLDDDNVVHHPGLVIRWAGDQYITRQDYSPLMDALPLWRTATILHRHNGADSPRPDSEISRPASPLSEEEGETETTPPTSGDEADVPRDDSIEDMKIAKPKPTSSSWIRWWSRSRRNPVPSSPVGPDFRATSEPPNDKLVRPVRSAEFSPAASAPTLPSTPLPEISSSQTIPQPPEEPPAGHQVRFAKTLRLSSDQLKTLGLRPGANSITFALSATGVVACTARIFLWDSTDHICISDIDGTITKSDGLGHVFAMIGRDWTHSGVAKLYTDITRNGYKILYLTSRAIGQADATRGYLKGIKQNDYQLPEGPVIMSPDRLMASLHREVIMRKPEVFKMACLRDIQRLFGSGKHPFYAGFGNRITDALSYRSVNVPSSRIFTIDSTGEVKLELLELAGYKSSYIHMTDLVDQMFPPIENKWAPEYTDFNYWRAPLQEFPLPDLSPPSPALSAKSDTSTGTLARLRNFSLVGPSRPSSPRTSPEPEDLSGTSPTSSLHLRRSPSLSSTSSIYGSDDEYSRDDALVEQRRRYRRERVTSITSITTESVQELEEEVEEMLELDQALTPSELHSSENYYEQSFDADSDDAFDEDLLAAGEMKNVPFL